MKEGLTIVIPVYNRGAIVGRTLDSIATQRRMPSEVILVDNASTDNTSEVLKRWQEDMSSRGLNVRVLTENRPGGASARQTGLESVETDKVMFFDSDDIMRPGHIADIYDRFEQTPDADIVIWSTLTHFQTGDKRYKPLLRNHVMDSHQLHASLATQAYAVKTEYIKRAGGWDRSLMGWDDLELGHRLLLADPKIVISDECNVDIYPQGAASITGTDYTHRRGEWENVIDIMERATLSSGHRDIPHIMRLLAYRRAILAALYTHEGNKEAGKEQLSIALQSRYLNVAQRLYLRMAYAVTSRGLRGAGRPVPYIL